MSEKTILRPELRRAYATGLEAAVQMLRAMVSHPSVAACSGPAALRIMANAIEASAREQMEKANAR